MIDSQRLPAQAAEQPARVSSLRQAPSLNRVRKPTTQSFVVGMTVFWGIVLLTALQPIWHVLILLPATVMSFVLAIRWENPSRGLLAWSFIVGVITAAVGSLLTVSPFSTGGLVIAGAAAIPTLRKARPFAAVGLMSLAVGLALLSAVRDPEVTPTYLAITLAFGVFWVTTFAGSHWTVRVMDELDDAHRTQTDLALYQEKFRFAADLHDIQGHTLHVVKMKAALAQKLLYESPEAADTELDEVRDLLADAIAQGKSLAYGERRLTLYGELENAKNLLEAAGATVSVYHGATGLPVEFEEPASLVLREATTNILRHSQATHVSISVDSYGVSITNDGLPDEIGELSGLHDLEQRVSHAGGRLTAQRDNNLFLTELRFPTSERKAS